jgi:hypothetical protein
MTTGHCCKQWIVWQLEFGRIHEPQRSAGCFANWLGMSRGSALLWELLTQGCRADGWRKSRAPIYMELISRIIRNHV